MVRIVFPAIAEWRAEWLLVSWPGRSKPNRSDHFVRAGYAVLRIPLQLLWRGLLDRIHPSRPRTHPRTRYSRRPLLRSSPGGFAFRVVRRDLNSTYRGQSGTPQTTANGLPMRVRILVLD